MAVAYNGAGAGAGHASGTSLSVAQPATVDADDILILHVMSDATLGTTVTPPAGYTLIGTREETGTVKQEAWCYWKRADGTEDGVSVNVTFGGTTSTAHFARIYRFTGCKTSGDPYEAFAATSGQAASAISSPTQTLSAGNANGKGVCLVSYGDDDIALPAFTTGELTWTEPVAEFASALGGDGTLQIQTYDFVDTSVPAHSMTVAESDPWITMAFFLLEATVANADAEVAWTELEVPNAQADAEISWAEFEVPNAQADAEISWAEFEVPNAQADAEVAWAELEVPDIPADPADAEISWAEFEVPNAGADCEISWAEFEVPNAEANAEVSWAEFEVPNAEADAEIAFAEVEVPSAQADAEISWAEFEVPDVGSGETARPRWLYWL